MAEPAEPAEPAEVVARRELPARLWVPAAMVVAAGLALPLGAALRVGDFFSLVGAGALVVLFAPGLFGALAARATTEREAAAVLAASGVAIVLALLAASLAAGLEVGCPRTAAPPAVVAAQAGPFAILALGYGVGAFSARALAATSTWAAFVIGGGIAGPAAAVALLSWISALGACRP